MDALLFTTKVHSQQRGCRAGLSFLWPSWSRWLGLEIKLTKTDEQERSMYAYLVRVLHDLGALVRKWRFPVRGECAYAGVMKVEEWSLRWGKCSQLGETEQSLFVKAVLKQRSFPLGIEVPPTWGFYDLFQGWRRESEWPSWFGCFQININMPKWHILGLQGPNPHQEQERERERKRKKNRTKAGKHLGMFLLSNPGAKLGVIKIY